MAQTQPVTIKYSFLPVDETWEGLMKRLKWEGESLIPVQFLCHSGRILLFHPEEILRNGKKCNPNYFQCSPSFHLNKMPALSSIWIWGKGGEGNSFAGVSHPPQPRLQGVQLQDALREQTHPGVTPGGTWEEQQKWAGLFSRQDCSSEARGNLSECKFITVKTSKFPLPFLSGGTALPGGVEYIFRWQGQEKILQLSRLAFCAIYTWELPGSFPHLELNSILKNT